MGAHDRDILIGHGRDQPKKSIALVLAFLLCGHQTPFELLPVSTTRVLRLPAALFESLDSLTDLTAPFFDSPLEIFSPSLQLHIQIQPGHDARDYTSDKNFCKFFQSSSCQGVRIRGPSGVTATVNSKWAASESSSE